MHRLAGHFTPGGTKPSPSFVLPSPCLEPSLVERGPFDPGKVIHPGKVLAGKDMGALDALGCGLLGVRPQEVLHIKLAHESGLGKMDLEGRVTRKTAAVSLQENNNPIPGITV